MSTLTVFLCIWAFVAFCTILVIRGATSQFASLDTRDALNMNDFAGFIPAEK